jgi:hypothetical protein
LEGFVDCFLSKGYADVVRCEGLVAEFGEEEEGVLPGGRGFPGAVGGERGAAGEDVEGFEGEGCDLVGLALA